MTGIRTTDGSKKSQHGEVWPDNHRPGGHSRFLLPEVQRRLQSSAAPAVDGAGERRVLLKYSKYLAVDRIKAPGRFRQTHADFAHISELSFKSSTIVTITGKKSALSKNVANVGRRSAFMESFSVSVLRLTANGRTLQKRCRAAADPSSSQSCLMLDAFTTFPHLSKSS